MKNKTKAFVIIAAVIMFVISCDLIPQEEEPKPEVIDKSKYKLSTPVVTATKNGTSVKILWNAVQNAKNYKVGYSTGNSETGDIIPQEISTVDITDYTDSSFTYHINGATSITYYVKAMPRIEGYVESPWGASNPVPKN